MFNIQVGVLKMNIVITLGSFYLYIVLEIHVNNRHSGGGNDGAGNSCRLHSK